MDVGWYLEGDSHNLFSIIRSLTLTMSRSTGSISIFLKDSKESWIQHRVVNEMAE